MSSVYGSLGGRLRINLPFTVASSPHSVRYYYILYFTRARFVRKLSFSNGEKKRVQRHDSEKVLESFASVAFKGRRTAEVNDRIRTF